jgi:long-chain acyl-CoA synthetase
MILSGQKGDANVLHPTTMPCVPIILDRIYKGIRAKIQARGNFFQQFFDFCFRYRRYWISKGFDTPILNAIVFKKFQVSILYKSNLSQIEERHILLQSVF